MTHLSSTSLTRWRGNLLQLDTPLQARILTDQVIEVNAQGTVHAVRAPLAGGSHQVSSIAMFTSRNWM
jgi:hypothetical protein